MSLLRLPFEILSIIFVLSSNEELAVCCRCLYHQLYHCHVRVKIDFLKQKHDNVTEAAVHYRFFDCALLKHLEAVYGRLDYTDQKIPSRLFMAEPTDTLIERQQLIEQLLQRGASPDRPNGYPLIKAAQQGNLSQVKLLIQYGASPTLRKNMALRVSAARNNKEMVLYFLNSVKVKPDPDTLKVCVQKNLWDMVQLLIQHGAVPDMSTLNSIPS